MRDLLRFKHVGVHGDPVKKAAAIHDTLALSKIPRAAPATTAPATAVDLHTAHLDEIISSIARPRPGHRARNAVESPPRAVVLTGNEINPVIKTLRSNGIDVTAIHSHMLDEQPRLFFLFFRTKTKHSDK